MELVDAAETTSTVTLIELVADTLSPPLLPAAAQALSELRDALEREHIGTPTG